MSDIIRVWLAEEIDNPITEQEEVRLIWADVKVTANRLTVVNGRTRVFNFARWKNSDYQTTGILPGKLGATPIEAVEKALASAKQALGIHKRMVEEGEKRVARLSSTLYDLKEDQQDENS